MSRILSRAIGLATLLVSLLLGIYGAGTLATAVGLSGTGGTLTVAGCRIDVSYSDRDRDADDRRETRRCWGDFSAADGSHADPQHELVSDEAQPGDRIEVRDNGTIYMERSAGSVAGAAAIVFVVLGMALIGALILITGHHPKITGAGGFVAAVHALRFGRAVLRTSWGALATAVIGFVLQEVL